jgi:hypothetical protein
MSLPRGEAKSKIAGSNPLWGPSGQITSREAGDQEAKKPVIERHRITAVKTQNGIHSNPVRREVLWKNCICFSGARPRFRILALNIMLKTTTISTNDATRRKPRRVITDLKRVIPNLRGSPVFSKTATEAEAHRGVAELSLICDFLSGEIVSLAENWE